MSTVNSAFWQGKRVLVTGHTGFKGAWACILLQHLGARVYGLSLTAERPSLYGQAHVNAGLSGEAIVDLRDAADVRAAVEKAAPEIVLHFAAQSLVRRAHRAPVETFGSNVLGTVNLLEALRSCASVTSILVTTTDKVYFNNESGQPFREGDRLGGHEPYSASKAAAEMAIAAYRGSYFAARGVALLVARAGNVIGGGDWSEDRIIPDIIRAVMSGAVMDVRNPQGVRPWQHVLEALSGYLLLVERKGRETGLHADPETHCWNFGPAVADEAITVEQICRWAAQEWPQRFTWQVTPDQSGVAESGVLLLDPAKAMSQLDWRPRMTPEVALRNTLAWYRAVLEGGDARAACERQIGDYLEGRL